jgi:hypothetical protein
MECLPSPTLDEVRKLVARTASAPVGNQHVLCIHWSPRLYAADEGPEGRWVSFVDPDGKHRDDARVYAIELARNAVPLTTLGDRPWNTELEFGPAPATGWALRLGVMRDHMPEAILIDWFAEVMSVPVGAIARAARPAFTRRP